MLQVAVTTTWLLLSIPVAPGPQIITQLGEYHDKFLCQRNRKIMMRHLASLIVDRHGRKRVVFHCVPKKQQEILPESEAMS